jgi:hypothetical protein
MADGPAHPDDPGVRPTGDAEVIDLSRARTRIVLESGASPFDRLDPDAQRRLLVRVLCELVAYDEVTDAPAPLVRV